jgi:NADH:ubiquinone oxidoreductase subunit 5 (subunit L)/multisubunit Na+/H+ antiporter MnhA subunit
MDHNIMIVGGATGPVLQKLSLFFIPLMPLVGAFFLGLCVFYKNDISEKLAGLVATMAAFGSFILTVICFNLILKGESAVGFTAWNGLNLEICM